MRPSVLPRLIGALAWSVLLGACAASSSGSAPAGTIEVSGAWIRPAAAGAETAAYFTITNHGSADKLIAVRTTVAGSTMIHQTATDSTGMTGMTGMSMIADVPIPAGGSVTLEPGGTHVMLAGLRSSLAAGATVELELVFEHAGAIRVATAVRPG
jgi:copper(I)-binding protein